MKTKVLIVVFLIASLICAFAFTGHSQTTSQSTEKDIERIENLSFRPKAQMMMSLDTVNVRTLIADETWITYTKTGAKIVTYSESVFRDVSLKFGNEFKRINILYKKDRNGPYKEYNIYLSKETASNIQQWAKTNL